MNKVTKLFLPHVTYLNLCSHVEFMYQPNWWINCSSAQAHLEFVVQAYQLRKVHQQVRLFGFFTIKSLRTSGQRSACQSHYSVTCQSQSALPTPTLNRGANSPQASKVFPNIVHFKPRVHNLISYVPLICCERWLVLPHSVLRYAIQHNTTPKPS